MRTCFFLFLCLFIPLFVQADFETAGRLYDEGQFPEALDVYQSIEGRSSALDYNIGNTLMRLGRTPEAIAYYRRALWQKPSDPDIRANLERASEQMTAVQPPLPYSRKLTGFMDAYQWQWVFILSCWLVAVLGILRMKSTRVRTASVWIFPLTATMLFAMGAGVWTSRPSAYFNEAVIKSEGVTARFEPLPDATERFVLPGGSTVTLMDQSRNWYKISAGEEEGWVPSDELFLLKDLGE